MIKRTLPNKSLAKSKRQGSCCKWITLDEHRTEASIDLHHKKTPLKIIKVNHSNTLSTTCAKQHKKADFIKLIPRNTLSLSKQSAAEPKIALSTAFKTPTAGGRDTPKTLSSSQIPANPLEKLHNRYHPRISQSFRLARRLSWGTPLPNQNTTQFCPKNQDLNPEQTIMLASFAKKRQLEVFEYENLKQEIQTYKKQYQSLIQEESDLVQEKINNRRLYQQMLATLYEKQRQMRESERIRRLELQELKQEISALLRIKEQQAE